MDKITVKELSPELWSDFEAYFEYKDKCSGCWCMNHRLPIGLNFVGEAAKLAMMQLVESGRVFGVLAYAEHDKVPIGWCSVDRRRTLPGHDCVEEDIRCSPNEWSIHCITTREDYKNKGLESALAKGGMELAKKKNGHSVEVYPEPGSSPAKPFKTWNTFNGYQTEFENMGFHKIEKDFGSHAEFYYPMKKILNN